MNADDLGVSRGATLGILKAHLEGIVTSASLAATTPHYQHAVEVCMRSCPDLGIGLHFTLTSGKPVSPVRQVPALVDGAGFFRWRFMPLLRAMSLGRRADLLEQIEMELEAQLNRIIRDGFAPDHIDGERHVHLIPRIFEKVVSAARRYRIHFVRAGTEIGTRFVGPGNAITLLAGGGFAKSILLSQLSRRDRKHLESGVGSADRFASYLYSGRLDLVLRNILGKPADGGITEIMVHPGLPEESQALSLGNHALERYLASEDRRKELHACIEARQWVSGWTLTTFGRLARG